MSSLNRNNEPHAANSAAALAAEFAALSPVDRLRRLRETVPGRIVFCTSFGLEDQVIAHLIAQAGLDIAFSTLDTGRLPPETYQLWSDTEDRYGIRVQAYFPDAPSVERLIADQGINGFRLSKEARLACCHVRKVDPLSRALANISAWIAGLRADQSLARSHAAFVEVDAARGALKASPLLDWTRDQAAAFAAQEGIPINPLHAQGFLSIGCAPCTRAVQPGEPERAGRWWWEDESAKECGLHLSPDGILVRNAHP